MNRSSRSVTAWRPRRTVSPLPTVEFPGAALVEPHAVEAQAGLEQPPLRLEVQLRHRGFAAVRSLQQRQLGRHEARVADEQLAARVQQAGVVPARGRHLLDDHDADRIGPLATDDGAVDPRDPLDARPDLVEVDGGKTPVHHFGHRAFDLGRRDALERAFDQHAPHGPVERDAAATAAAAAITPSAATTTADLAQVERLRRASASLAPPACDCACARA